MKLQFKHQKFQADAAKAVVDVFAGQPYLTPSYMMDKGYGQQTIMDDTDFTGWRNECIVPELSDKLILERLQKVLCDSRYTHSDHIGLINVNARVQLLYGVSYGLTLESVPFERTRVCLKMPRIASDETAPTGGNPNV